MQRSIFLIVVAVGDHSTAPYSPLELASAKPQHCHVCGSIPSSDIDWSSASGPASSCMTTLACQTTKAAADSYLLCRVACNQSKSGMLPFVSGNCLLRVLV